MNWYADLIGTVDRVAIQRFSLSDDCESQVAEDVAANLDHFAQQLRSGRLTQRPLEWAADAAASARFAALGAGRV